MVPVDFAQLFGGFGGWSRVVLMLRLTKALQDIILSKKAVRRVVQVEA